MKNSSKSISPFTIIIPVIHSLKDLEWCLTSIAKLDYPKDRFHVVLVDSHVVPGLRSFLTKIPPDEFTFRFLTLPERSLTGPDWLHEQEVEALKKYRHVFPVDISLDGPKPVHDSIRRVRGSHEKVTQAIQVLVSVFPVTINCVVQNEKCGGSYRRCRYLQRLGGQTFEV